METSADSVLYLDAKATIALSLVGFLDVFSDPPPEFPCLGSGTLVRVGTARGIVTAAHVNEVLQIHSRVGLVRFAGTLKQALTLSMEFARVEVFGNSPWTNSGPDIAFLAIPNDVADALEAYGCVFLNLESCRDQILARGYANRGFFCIVGMLGELTTLAKSAPNRVDVAAEALVELVDLGERRVNPPFDYVDCVPIPAFNDSAPNSYGGMSGGGLFIVHTATAEGGTESVSSITFAGVSFWQSGAKEGRRVITCHFADGIYGPLQAAIKANN